MRTLACQQAAFAPQPTHPNYPTARARHPPLQIVRDFLLQGPHPGSSTPEIVAFLKPLLQAGVTTFVCLQGELPSSATSQQNSRSATYGMGGAISAKPYFEGALAMVRAGGYPMSATPDRLSFVHYPMAPSPGFVPEPELLKKVVRSPSPPPPHGPAHPHCHPLAAPFLSPLLLPPSLPSPTLQKHTHAFHANPRSHARHTHTHTTPQHGHVLPTHLPGA